MSQSPPPQPPMPPTAPSTALFLSRRLVVVGLLRSVAILAAALVVYALLPIESLAAAWTIGALASLGLFAVGWVFVRQVRRIAQAPHPVMAAAEAFTLVFGLFLTLFATLYLCVDHDSSGAFSEPLDKLAGIYFSVTVMATVGFGDIAPVGNTARVLVTVQMVLDMILIGAAVKILLGTAKRALPSHPAST